MAINQWLGGLSSGASRKAAPLGGGRDTNLLPTKKELEQDISLFPQLPPNGAGLRLAPPENPANR